MFDRIPRDERISFFTHFFGFISGLFALAFICITVRKPFPIMVISLIYIFMLIFMFGASSLYHGRKSEENGSSFLRKLDHLAIFFMIAGTYTPICYLFLDGYWRWAILITQWALVLCGIFFKFFFIRAPRVINTIIYLVMGWIAIIPIKQLVDSMPVAVICYLGLGGLFYTIGAIIYMIKKPNIIRGYFGFHEIFHIFILLGAGAHFIMVWKAINLVR
jgi:hemolysin III